MRKPAFCIMRKQRGRSADQRLCFHYRIVQSLFSLNPKFQASSHRFVSDLVRNPKDRFSRDAAHIIIEEYFLSIVYKNRNVGTY